MYEIFTEGRIAAAHFLENYNGKCENLHGHNWVIRVYVKGNELDETGLLIDFTLIKKALEDVSEKLDHTLLNDNEFFMENNPTAENIARWYFEGLSGLLNKKDVKVSKVTVWESEKQAASYS